MAIGYSGPRAMSMLLNVNSGVAGTPDNKKVYLSTTIAALQPMLAAPFILNVIKNTSRTEGSNGNVNSRYYYQQKSGKATLISNSDNSMIVDPRTITAENIDVTVKQVAPQSVAKKFSGARRDFEIEGLENLAAAKIASYMVERRLDKQIAAWQLLFSGAQATQKNLVAADSAAVTWDKGAHWVKESFTTADDIYDALRTSISKFKKLGLSNAPSKFNQDLLCVKGIQANDMLIVMNTEMSSLLLGKQGLYASDSGNELFQKLNLKTIWGIPLLIDDTLPEGTNFMIFTTGTHGALAYEECGTIAQQKSNGMSIATLEQSATILPDPQWSGFYRIDYEETYKMDIIFPELVFVSSEAEAISGRSMKIDVRDGSVSEETVNKIINNNKDQIANLEETKKGILKDLEAQNSLPKENRDNDKIAQLTAQLKSTTNQIKDLEKSVVDLNKVINN